MSEQRKPIDGYDGMYLITADGKVFNSRGFELKQDVRGRGYPSVKLFKGGIGTAYTVHRLVASAFCENPNGYDCVNHINGIKDDNRAENLEWCTQSQNTNHAYKANLKLMNERPVVCIESGIRYRSASEAAREYLVDPQAIIHICRGNNADINGLHFAYENMYEMIYRSVSAERENPQPLTCVGCKREESYVTIGRNPIECIRCRRFHAEDHYEPKGEHHG